MAKTRMGKTPYLKIRLLSARLELRPYRFSDFECLQKSHSGRIKSANKFDEPIPTSKESDIEKYKARLKRHRASGKDEHHFIFGVFDKKDGSYIGQIDLFTINKELRWANIGYHIQNQYFDNGYATEASGLGLRAALT